MEQLWNERNLYGPPINTKLQRASNLDLSELRSVLNKSIQVYQHLNFTKIAALASRLIAKRNSSFRSQYGFKLLRKTNVALARLAHLNIQQILEDFLGGLPDFRTGKQIDLPTKDNFDFVLVRLQSLAKLLVRIAESARDSATFFLKYIHRTFFLETCVFYVGLLAKVWTMAQRFTVQTAQVYAKLYTFRLCFKNNKKEWLPAECVMPETLDGFLGGDDFRKEFPSNGTNRIKWGASKEKRRKLDDQSKDIVDNGESSEEIAEDNLQPKRKIQLNLQKTNDSLGVLPPAKKITSNEKQKISSNFNQELDIGIAINRKTMQIKRFAIESVSKTEDIQKFIDEEDRLQSTEQSSIPIAPDQWKELRSKINVIIVTSQGRNCVKNFKKLWHKQCRK